MFPEPNLELEKFCHYCGEQFAIGERAVYRLRGVVTIGHSGRPYVESDSYDPEEPVVLHEACEVPFLKHIDGAEDDDGELLRFCAGCGTKLGGGD